MRVFSLISVLFLFVSCNEIDGKLKVFSDFMLTDEDGREVAIGQGVYSAEFSGDSSGTIVELDVDDVDDGSDRDFDFGVPNLSDIDLRAERVEITVSAEESGQSVDAQVLITNTIISERGPMENVFRCGRHATDYRRAIYMKVDRYVDVAVRLLDGEEELALFEGTERVKDRRVLWSGECGDLSDVDWEYTPPGSDDDN